MTLLNMHQTFPLQFYNILSTLIFIEINAFRTQAMVIGPIPYVYCYNFSADNDAVDTTYTLNILGAALDGKLNFVAHVSEQVKKACGKASVLRRIHKFIPFYYIDTSVLLENIPLVKFIKTTSRT